MSHYSGKAGEVTSPTTVSGIKSWTLDYTLDTQETTDFADSGVKSYVAGCTGWTGSYEGFKDGTAQVLSTGSSIALVLKETQTATQQWSGSAFITGIHAAAAVDGVVTYSYDFQGTGVLIVPTA